jgi:hypothetical protein
MIKRLTDEIYNDYTITFYKYPNGYVEGYCEECGIKVGVYKTKKETFEKIKNMIDIDKNNTSKKVYNVSDIKVEFGDETLKKYASKLLDSGYELYTTDDNERGNGISYFTVHKNGKFAYVQSHRFGGIIITSVNKPDRKYGTGTQKIGGYHEGEINPTINNMEYVLNHNPAPDYLLYENISEWKEKQFTKPIRIVK